ncbi:transferase, partial [candidate division KSB3 bacterium]|nr:transferase [candidate division KSB3 bacterium]MBD3326201.1 transferase [candidate division KSB3 bacterium]
MAEQQTIIHPNVRHGTHLTLGSFVILGEPPRGTQSGELATFLGDHALIRSHTVIYAGNRIGHHFQTGHGVMIR